MSHEPDTAALAVLALCIVVWGAWSARLERWNVTAPIAFVLAGLLVANEPLALVQVEPSGTTVRIVAELTLALVLFNDAARVNLGVLRSDAAIPARLLLIGLPLTIAAGTAVAIAAIAGVDLWVAAVIGAAVAPTDAALGAPIMEDPHIPGRIRRVLNVESGLNDGIATPFVWFFLAGATGSAFAGGPLGALADLGVGVVVGAGVGAAGGWLLGQAANRGWSTPAARPLVALALALVAYTVAVETGGNGFVSAFVGGMLFGTVRGDGDRGLASVVFALLALDTLAPSDGERVVSTISAVVLLSIVAHGISAAPIARRYTRALTHIAPDRPRARRVRTTSHPTVRPGADGAWTMNGAGTPLERGRPRHPGPGGTSPYEGTPFVPEADRPLVQRAFRITRNLPKYPKRSLRSDVVAGVTVAAR